MGSWHQSPSFTALRLVRSFAGAIFDPALSFLSVCLLVCTFQAISFDATAAPAGNQVLPISAPKQRANGPKEVNSPSAPDPSRVFAIVGANLIDGRGGPPVSDAVVIVQGAVINAAGPRKSIKVPDGAEIFDAAGLTVLPGLMDAHFHLDRVSERPRWFLPHGVTSMRDPGAPFEDYDAARQSELPMPRFFLAGPHLDCAPPAYPHDAFLVNDPAEVRQAVNRFADQGASVIKVYFRLPLEWIQAATETAHARGIPVTAHLELVRADDAIRAGIDGIEHITSFGTVLAEPAEAERFRETVRAQNEARRKGRYELWDKIDLDHSPRVKPLIDLIVQRRIFISPTLAVFEVRAGDKNASDIQIHAYQNMLKFAGLCHRAGATFVVGSHSEVPKAERGWAYHRELELLVECGLSPAETIVAATSNNARYFRVEDRLGSIVPGKLADLVLVEGNPLLDIRTMRKVRQVMLNGKWVPREN